MNKKDLIDFIELNNIKHYTPDIIKREIQLREKSKFYKNIIIYNIMRYDNVNVEEIEDHEKYVKENNLDTDIKHLQDYALLMKSLYDAYEIFCKKVGVKCNSEKLKSFPKIISSGEAI